MQGSGRNNEEFLHVRFCLSARRGSAGRHQPRHPSGGLEGPTRQPAANAARALKRQPAPSQDPILMTANSDFAQRGSNDPLAFADARPVTLALQGGGSLGAFAWGVLDRLLEAPGRMAGPV